MFDRRPPLLTPRRLAAAFCVAAAGGLGWTWLDDFLKNPLQGREGVRVISHEISRGKNFVPPVPAKPDKPIANLPSLAAPVAGDMRGDRQIAETIPLSDGSVVVLLCPPQEDLDKAKTAYNQFLVESDPLKKFEALSRTEEIQSLPHCIDLNSSNYIAQLRTAGVDATRTLIAQARSGTMDALDTYFALAQAGSAHYTASFIAPQPPYSRGIMLDYDIAARLTGIAKEELEQWQKDVLPLAMPVAMERLQAIIAQGGPTVENALEYERLYSVFMAGYQQEYDTGKSPTEEERNLFEKDGQSFGRYTYDYARVSSSYVKNLHNLRPVP